MEAAGLATVALSLVRPQIERSRPPRALHCEFPLGRPLGRPGDPEFQRHVLSAAFALLERPAGPVLEDFPETITDEADTPLTCPLPPRYDPSLPAAVDEARALRPAWERAREASGGTQVGRVVDPDGIPEAVAAFVLVAEGVPWREAGLPGDPAAVAMDIRTYYEEAAVALADHVPAARAAESWLYRTTSAGAVLKAAMGRMAQDDPPYERIVYLVPISQQ
jgi:D-proline reductase (dithiol) PrdB